MNVLSRFDMDIAKTLAILVLAISLSSCATSGRKLSDPVHDPYEHFNRVMYNFNDAVDRMITKPVAKVYNYVLPTPVNKGITNFFNNIAMIPTIINDLLQANFYQGVSDSWRLLINTTVGLLGFIDVASEIGLEPNYEDLNLTFAKWGYKDSVYLILPFLGPSTVRGSISWPLNYYFFTIYPHIPNKMERHIIYSTGYVDERAGLLRMDNFMQQAALDEYVFMRNAYLQRQKYLIERNEHLGDPYTDEELEEIDADFAARNPIVP